MCDVCHARAMQRGKSIMGAKHVPWDNASCTPLIYLFHKIWISPCVSFRNSTTHVLWNWLQNVYIWISGWFFVFLSPHELWEGWSDLYFVYILFLWGFIIQSLTLETTRHAFEEKLTSVCRRGRSDFVSVGSERRWTITFLIPRAFLMPSFISAVHTETNLFLMNFKLGHTKRSSSVLALQTDRLLEDGRRRFNNCHLINPDSPPQDVKHRQCFICGTRNIVSISAFSGVP